MIHAVAVAIDVARARKLIGLGESERALEILERSLSRKPLASYPSEVVLTLAMLRSLNGLEVASDAAIAVAREKLKRSRMREKDVAYMTLYADCLSRFNQGEKWEAVMSDTKTCRVPDASPHLRANFPLD